MAEQTIKAEEIDGPVTLPELARILWAGVSASEGGENPVSACFEELGRVEAERRGLDPPELPPAQPEPPPEPRTVEVEVNATVIYECGHADQPHTVEVQDSRAPDTPPVQQTYKTREEALAVVVPVVAEKSPDWLAWIKVYVAGAETVCWYWHPDNGVVELG